VPALHNTVLQSGVQKRLAEIPERPLCVDSSLTPRYKADARQNVRSAGAPLSQTGQEQLYGHVAESGRSTAQSTRS
jgi:hypothetical protein